MISRATPHPDLPAPAPLIRDWRLDASARVIDSLLSDVGCASLTVDDIAKSLGVAKGSIYLRWPDIARITGILMDRRTDSLIQAANDPNDAPPIAICGDLLAPVESTNGVRPAIPCCLHASPCPHGWTLRWAQLAKHYGMGTSGIAQLIGEAIQAVASSPTVRELLEQGQFDAAAEVVAIAVNGPDDDDE